MLENKANQDTSNHSSLFEKFKTLTHLPNFSQHLEQMEQKNLAPQHDLERQKLYDDAKITENPDNLRDLLLQFELHNKESASPVLASGQSGYFTEQIMHTGFEQRLRLDDQTQADAKFIAKCFGKTINYGANQLPILYTTLPGSVEFGYATQTFPAGIYEDVFQESPERHLSTPPLAYEPERLYWQRVLSTKLDQQNLPAEQAATALSRGNRLIDSFCRHRNRVYYLPIDDLRQNPISFGDIKGLRDGQENSASMSQILQTLLTLDQTFKQNHIHDIYGTYNNANFACDYGVAIYGPIKSQHLKYIEVDRKYDILQTQAKLNGLKPGEPINFRIEL